MIKKIKSLILLFFAFTAVSCAEKNESSETDFSVKTGSMQIDYAEQFSVDYYENGCSEVKIGDDRFLIVPENVDIPENTDIPAIKQPVENIYVSASSAMDLFDGIDKLDRVKMTSTNAQNWSLPNIKNAVSSGSIQYIGKYSSPDYEMLISQNCGLAVESTMIYHAPEVKEQIESLGIPVIVERSSYETHPLGRMEWIKLYGLITGDYESAEKLFNEKINRFEEVSKNTVPVSERKTVAFFYITSNGYFNIRKPNDYVSKMIDLAGGKYVFTAENLNVDDNALSTMNIQAETFYEIARNADILIYNSTVEGELYSVDSLVEKCSVLADFKAVKEGCAWCTGQNMFQQTTGTADMICDLNKIFTDTADSELTYLHRLES